jgi:signal transduction histidine kinase
VVSIVGYYLLSKIEIDNYKTMLKNMINQFDSTYENLSNIDKTIKDIHKKTGVRVTIIGFDGDVKYESNRKIEGMGSHMNRPELLLSNAKKFGSSIRHSKSVDKDLLYVAKRTDKFYIRMAYPLKGIYDKFFRFWIYAVVIFLGVMVLAFWITYKINIRVAYDLRKIKEGLDSIIDKKYDTIFEGEKCCEEFDVISKQINRVSKRLDKRNRQKIKHTRRLKELNKQQGDIISAISHEFKNPVAAIVGYASTIREDKDLSQDIQNRFLDKVIKNAQKISYMIDRLSMAIKLENDNFKLNLKSFDIKDTLNDVKETLIQKYKNAEILIDVPSTTITADEVMFENLLINLIENAIKYSDDEVVVRLENDILKVIDKGVGINQEDIEKVTKRFYRVESLEWDNSIGVGLYIVKYILKLHKIELIIKSEPEVGSQFCFDIGILKKDSTDK